ncbi:hypothetical protein O181_061730 [Austropuccinia psidii MF-1]|uniref:Uncharacterized protein n=1 Tax=Austropuccinia psidii MF-1 TaxID=1389203 RepID=A0A9Q3EFQ9_9BASI|nr:hypothetical protein [Austropuccinia psidii MF-1]
MSSYLQVKKLMGPEKTGTSEGLDTHVLQSTNPTDKILVEKPEHVIRGPEDEIGLRKVKQPSGSSTSLHKQNLPQQVANKPKQAPKTNQKGKQKAK